jgi:hypothetical protein
MWIKCTEEEIVAAKSKAKRKRLYLAIFIGVLCFAFITFTHGKWSYRYGSFSVTLKEMPFRLPFGIIAGIVIAWLFYRRLKKANITTVICLNCGKTKYEDAESECACGGHFEDVITMKWVDRN